MVDVTVITALLAGLISFISPCVLPLVPGYLCFISGKSVQEMRDEERRAENIRPIAMNSLFFIAGFSLVFILMGATATKLGEFVSFKLSFLSKAAGIMLVLFGLHMMGVFKIKFLYMEKRFHARRKRLGLVGAFIVGLAFAFGWTPCVGPILAAVLTLAAMREGMREGILLLFVYSMGLGIPFFLTAIGLNTFLRVFGRIKRHSWLVEVVSGVMLIIIGVMIYTNNLAQLASILPEHLSYLQDLL